MDIYLARQPIFDRNMSVYGYELLYRQSMQNQFPGLDDNQATAELIYNSFLVMGLQDITEGRRAFINFSKDLIDSDVPYLLPSQTVVVEVLERNRATQATIAACQRLRNAGYTLALDDFILDEQNLPLIHLADIIKVEYPSVSHGAQRTLIQKYSPKIKFLAEKIETREDYRLAVEMGYDYFQGYFFSRPAVIGSKEIRSLDANVVQILQELSREEPNYNVLSNLVTCDLGLSYKLLKLANSIRFESKNQINTIAQALTYVGTRELRQWAAIMALKQSENIENAEMVKLSLVRGKLMELMAKTLDGSADTEGYFLTGIFSFVDILLAKPMDEILKGLPLADDVKSALLKGDNNYRKFLDCVTACEMAVWGDKEEQYPLRELGAQRFMDLYFDSLRWVQALNY